MGRTNVVVDEELVERARRLYGLRTKREIIDLALRRLVGGDEKPWHAALTLEGSGW
nr:type II toxin-antitoxin system VapB family antitoxin [Pseudonocardiales bacterium]